MKRKKDLNQSGMIIFDLDTVLYKNYFFHSLDKVIKRPPRSKNAKKNVAQTDTSDHETNEGHQVQSMHVPLQNQVEYLMSVTRGQFRDPNLRNEHGQYQNQVEYPVTDEQSQGANLQNEHLRYQNQMDYSIHVTEAQFQDPNFQNEHLRHQYMLCSHSRTEDPSNPQVSPLRNNHFR